MSQKALRLSGMSWLASARSRLFDDPPTPEGETHALAMCLRGHKNKRVGLMLDDRCEPSRLDGDVLRVNVTGTAVFLRVNGKEVMVPLDRVIGLIV